MKNNDEYELGIQHCKEGRIPCDGMCDEYYEGFARELGREGRKTSENGQTFDAIFNEIFAGEI